MAHLYEASHYCFSPPRPERQGWCRRALMLALLGVLAMHTKGYAQGGNSDDNVLYPQPDPLPIMLGVEGGYGTWKHEGFFSVADGNRSCTTFENGEGEGRTYGIKGMVYLTRWLFFSPRVRLEARSGSFISPLAGEPARDASNTIVMLDQEAQVDATISTLSFEGTIGIEFFGLYLFGGGSMGTMLDGTYNYSERLKGATDGFAYADTRDNRHQLVTGRTFENYQKRVFDLRYGVGYILRIGPIAVNPELLYTSPQTSALNLPDEMKQTGVVGTFAILYNFR